MTKSSFIHGMHINIVFARSNPELSHFVLSELGFPFAKPESSKK
jgi:ribosomal protein L5